MDVAGGGNPPGGVAMKGAVAAGSSNLLLLRNKTPSNREAAKPSRYGMSFLQSSCRKLTFIDQKRTFDPVT